jgi:lipoprotein-anchoring transpeptidase ErfK/SrfK
LWHNDQYENSHVSPYNAADYSSRMPSHINTTEKVVIVNPNVHAWGAYDRNGELVKAGIATAGGQWCNDIGRGCHTATGTFRIYSLGDSECISRIYPLPNGGGLMPYCMYFHGGQALHGSPDNAVVEDNISHGCVRMRIPDAEWLRYNFAQHGTKVIVEAY